MTVMAQFMVCAPFDAELFGHWWFEGPRWLYAVLKEVAIDPAIETATMNDFYTTQPPTESPFRCGSWGKGGFHWIWLNDWTR